MIHAHGSPKQTTKPLKSLGDNLRLLIQGEDFAACRAPATGFHVLEQAPTKLPLQGPGHLPGEGVPAACGLPSVSGSGAADCSGIKLGVRDV